MRIGFVFYWCVFAFHLCKADDVERTEHRDSGRRPQWGPVVRSGSYMSDSAVTASNEQSESWTWVNTSYDTCLHPSRESRLLITRYFYNILVIPSMCYLHSVLRLLVLPSRYFRFTICGNVSIFWPAATYFSILYCH